MARERSASLDSTFVETDIGDVGGCGEERILEEFETLPDETLAPDARLALRMGPARTRALLCLSVTNNTTRAAREAGVNRTTIYRWKTDPEFRRELERLRQDALVETKQEMKGLPLLAARQLGELLEHPEHPHARILLAAIRTTFTYGLSLPMAESLEMRLDNIEEALALKKRPIRL